MTISTVTTKISTIFLAIVLVAGTIALSPPSFMNVAQATSDHEKYDDKKSYGKDRDESRDHEKYDDKKSYGKDRDDKKSYGKDRDESRDHEKYDDKKSYGKDRDESKYTSYGKDRDSDKSKDSSVNIKKVKCNNVNVNVNGLELNVLPPVLSGLIESEAQASDEGERGASSYGSGNGGSYGGGQSSSDGDFKFVCINNNNNTVVGVDEDEDGVTPPPQPIEDKCEECFNANATLAGIITDLLEVPGAIPLSPQFEGVVIGADVTTIAELCDFLNDEIAEGNISQTAEALATVISIILSSSPHPDVTEDSFVDLVNCLLDVDFV